MAVRPICEPVELPPGAAVLVERVRHDEASPELGRFLHFHDLCELVLFDDVHGAFVGDGRRHRLAANAIVFVPSMRHHDFALAAGAKSWRLLQIDPYVVERLAREPGHGRLLRPFCAVPDKDQKRRLDVLAEWLAEDVAEEPRSLRAVRLVELLLLAVLDAPEVRHEARASEPQVGERLLPALERLRLEPGAVLPLEEAAAACRLSPAYFSRRFKQVFGMNFSQYARIYRLHLAARRLVSGSSAVSEIAYSLGFSSASHFTQRFGERFGMSPRAYRESARRTVRR